MDDAPQSPDRSSRAVVRHTSANTASRAGRLDGETEDERVGNVAHFHEEFRTERENVPALDLALADDPDDATRTRVKIAGVPDQPGKVAYLFQLLADNAIEVSEIEYDTSEAGTLAISFTVSKASQPAFMFAYSEFNDQLRGGRAPS